LSFAGPSSFGTVGICAIFFVGSGKHCWMAMLAFVFARRYDARHAVTTMRSPNRDTSGILCLQSAHETQLPLYPHRLFCTIRSSFFDATGKVDCCQFPSLRRPPLHFQMTTFGPM
jgi:hypothetical protein